MSDVLRRFAATIPRPAPVDGGEARALDRLRAEVDDDVERRAQAAEVSAL